MGKIVRYFFLLWAAAFMLVLEVCHATQEGDAVANVLKNLNYGGYNATDPCKWDTTRIMCDSTSGRITMLNFSRMGLSGTLSSDIGVFTSATFLSLSNNSLQGTLPNELGNLVNLRTLWLSYTFSNIPFPQVLTKLTNLVELRMDHCTMTGVIPTEISSLSKLQYMYLGNNTLTGPIPSSIGSMTTLQEISLWSNNFINYQIPKEIWNLPNLDYLNVHDCNLWGPLPSEAATPKNLTKLLLYSNYFTGSIPDAWQSMTAISTLNIRQNYLSGVFPLWLPMLPKLTLLDVSANEFSGTFPQFNKSAPLLQVTNPAQDTFNLACNYFNGTYPTTPYNINVTGNCFVNTTDKSVDKCVRGFTCLKFQSGFVQGCAPCPSGEELQDSSTCVCQPIGYNSGKSDNTFPYGPVIGGLVGLLALLLFAFAMFRYKPFHIFDPFLRKDKYGPWDIPSGVKRFTFLELSKATDNFSEAHEIGAGGFGKVYRGTMDDGKMVAIKRASALSVQGVHEFRNEVVLLSRLHHRHLVRLEGFCDDKKLQILVYEFMKNGNLHDQLLDENGSKQLTWVKRLEIAVGVAKGLDYLHSYADPPVIHRDIKPSNILLDEGLVAKVSDFGISKENQDFFTHISTRPAGTAGYLDPEYFLRRQLTTASDVYAYGVVLLEIITGQEAIDHLRFEELNLIEWVKPRFRNEGVEKIVDPALGDNYDKEILKVMTEVAIMCAAFSKNDRPSMKEVLTLLEPHLHAVNPLSLSKRLSSMEIDENEINDDAILYAQLKSNISAEVQMSQQSSSHTTGSSNFSFDAPVTSLLPR